MTKIIAYLRVSKNEQDVSSQEHAILKYANNNNISILNNNFRRINVSSRKSNDERGITSLLKELKHGDTLIVSELSRLGRSAGQVHLIIESLKNNGVKIICIKGDLIVDPLLKTTDTVKNTMNNFIIAIFSLMAEMERDLISVRTKEGLAALKATGKKLGRQKGTIMPSKLDSRVEEIKNYLSKKVSISSLARILGVSRFVLDNFMKSRKISK